MGLNNIQPNITAGTEQQTLSHSSGSANIAKTQALKQSDILSTKKEDVKDLSNTYATSLGIDNYNTIKGEKEKPETIKLAVKQLNNVMQTLNKRLSFFIDEKSGRFGVKVIDSETDKVIRQIPPEEVLGVAAKIQEMIGMLVDERS